MARTEGSFLACLIIWTFGAILAWLMWGPLLHWLFSLIPPTSDTAWLGKLISVIVVGYFGGIAIPIFCFFGGIVAWNLK